MMNIDKIKLLSQRYDILSEDVFFISLNFYGIDANVEYPRIRFEFEPNDNVLFKHAKKRNIIRFFHAVPIREDSPFSLSAKYDLLLFNGEVMGKVYDVHNDTCDVEYTRNLGRVLNLNPVSKSNCHGCKFCHTIIQEAKDRIDIKSAEGLTLFIEKWLHDKNIHNLAEIEQIAIVTGTFGSVLSVKDYCCLVRNLLKKYSYKNELFYFGSEVDAISLQTMGKECFPFALCYTLECFDRREDILKSVKAQKTIQDIQKLFKIAMENKIEVNFSYVLGIDSLQTIKKSFTEIVPHITRFPIINIYQRHRNIDDSILDSAAHDIEYYLETRNIIESIFLETPMRPRTWENYRSLWYLSFANEELKGNRLP